MKIKNKKIIIITTVIIIIVSGVYLLNIDKYVPQFVLITFDGAREIEMWKETREFAQQMKKENKPIHFTYFVSGTYLINREDSELYTPPIDIGKKSEIDFSGNTKETQERIRQINLAIDEGHEFASHNVGHFSGKDWSVANWNQEIKSFSDLIFHSASNIGIEFNFRESDIIGFRAPYLDVNNDLFKSLRDNNYKYDASIVSRESEWPQRDENGIWKVKFGTLYIGKDKSPSIPVDYTLSVYKYSEQDTYDAYLDYFNRSYFGNRAPIMIDEHFAKLGDGAYWNALKRFASTVCGMKEVKCVSVRELIGYLEE